MRSLAVLLLAAVCLTVPRAQAQEAASVPDWRFAHPNPTLVGGVRLKSLLESPVVNSMIEESSGKDPNAAMVAAMVKGALGGVTEIRFSLLDTSKAKGGEPGKTEMDALVLVSGKLDEALVGALSQGKASFRRIDANTVLLGTGPSLEEAAARMTEPPGLLRHPALIRGSSLKETDVWFAGALPETPMTGELNDNLRGLALGMSVSNDVALELAMEAATAAMAQELVAKAREAEATQPQLGIALNAVVEDTTARFRVVVPAEKVAEAIRQGVAAQAAGALSNSDPPVPPPPANRGSIVIQGLEGGTKEIPASGK